jgi:exonuclease III
MINNFPKLKISAINVNSFNVSTLGMKNSKTLLKVEVVTAKRPDVILLTDVRAKDKSNELVKLFRLTQNGCYNLYLHSSKENRGVGIAIKRNIATEIIGITRDRTDENFILMSMVIKGKRLTMGSVYGPNANEPDFFRRLRLQIEQMGNDYIIGGDMNTVLCNRNDGENLDRIGIGRIPNALNSRELNNWISDGFAVDPFRALYPFEKEVSYIPFRIRNNEHRYSRSRLDFYLISGSIIDSISKVKYEDRIGSDFDHKEVFLFTGRDIRNNKTTVYDTTLADTGTEALCTCALYNVINNHLVNRDEILLDI